MSLFGKMKDVYKLQKEAKKVKEKLKKMHIEAEVEGITVIINGEQEVISVTINDAARENPKKMEENLVATFNKAIKKSQEVAANEMKVIMGGMGLDLPGLN